MAKSKISTTKGDLLDIRDMVRRVEEGTADDITDKIVYRMFGSLSKDVARGVVIGIDFSIANLRE